MIQGYENIRYMANISRSLRNNVVVSQSGFTLSQQIYDWGANQWRFEIATGARGRVAVKPLTDYLISRNGNAKPLIFMDPYIKQMELARYESRNVWFFSDPRHISISFASATRLVFDENSIPDGSYFTVDDNLYQLEGGFTRRSDISLFTARTLIRYRGLTHVPGTTHPIGKDVIWGRPHVRCRLEAPLRIDAAGGDLIRFNFNLTEDIS